MRPSDRLGAALGFLVLVAASPVAAQTEALTLFPSPGDPTSMIVVTRSTGASSSRGSVLAWVTPSRSSGESASMAVGIVSRAPAAREAFTLVSETQACVTSSEERVTLFAGMTAAGDTLEGRVVPLGACTAVVLRYALAGAHPAARLVRLHDDPAAASRLPATLPQEATLQVPSTATGLPFVILSGTRLSTGVAFAYCDGSLLAQRPAYASVLLTDGAATYLVAQPVAFADGALWRLWLVPLVCPTS